MEKVKRSSGITLIALVVTIVVLIILAVISVNLVMNGNIIGRAEQSKDIQAKATELERLELVKGDVAIDNKGKVTVDDYIEEAIKQGIASEDEVEDNGDGSKNIITDNGWNVNIAPDPDNENNVIITIEGKGNELKPVISKMDTNTTKSSITVNIKVRHLNEGKVEYYYRLHGRTPEDSYKKAINGTNEGATITGLTEGERYDIKVVATNINGEDTKEKTDIIAKDFVAISKITLNAKSTRMAAGYTRTLIATVEPSNATNKELEWITTDANLAAVINGGIGAFGTEGNVKSASSKSGKVTITAKAKDGSDVTESCEVDVVIADEIKTIVGNTTPANTNRTMCDEYGNLITIPADFTVVANGKFGTTYSYTGNTNSPSVQDGIVIKDKDDNQFTWVPTDLVQNKAGDKNGSSKNIILGRYTFDSDGKEILQQDADDWENETIIGSHYQELTTYREGLASQTDGLNATARDLNRFVTETKANSGYYMGRYEASYKGKNRDNKDVPYCKESTTADTNSTLAAGKLWNNITQIDAAAASRNMYGDGTNYASDLVNSYAWDTAIVYIQTYSDNEKYSRQTSVNTGSNPTNTGTTGDKVCNIYDMASNMYEWTTESNSVMSNGELHPCVFRGGFCGHSTFYTAVRSNYDASNTYYYYTSFRPILYSKTGV